MNSIATDREYPLTYHLRELRSRMWVVTIVLLVSVMITFPFSADIIQIIWHDLIPPQVDLVVYTPMEWLITRLTVSLVAALFAAVPVIIYELFAFIKPGLYPNEKKFFLLVFPPSLLLFLSGAAVAYFIVIPIVFNYMVMYSADAASSGLSVKQTFSIISTMMVIFGLLFQFPMLVIFSIKSGLLKRQQLKEKRMLVYGTLVAFAMFVAPDVTGMSQLIMAFFLLLLFEFSLLISRFI